MTRQHPFTSQPAPIEKLLFAAGTFEDLPLYASKEEVDVSFDSVRSLPLDLMVGSIDAHPYKPSWETLSYNGDAELKELMDMSNDSPEYSDNQMPGRSAIGLFPQ
jgi:hypothetical protein